MKTQFPLSLATIAALAVSVVGGCVHTPPGTSVEIALAKKAQLFRLPAPPDEPKVAKSGRSSTFVASVEPELPVMDDRIEAEAEAFTRGKFAMADGNNGEAIEAFEKSVHLDPTRQEAWQNLAVLYEKVGSDKKALEAFRKSKNLARR